MDEARQGTADKLIRNVFRYMDKNARDIMTHRKNIVAIDEEESLEDALHFMLETRRRSGRRRFRFTEEVLMRSSVLCICARP